MVPLKNNDRATGFFTLLLILLLLYALKPAAEPAGSSAVPCGEPLFIQVEGDVNFPGVYPFCVQPDLKMLVETAGGLTHGRIALRALEYFTLRSGIKITLRVDGKQCTVSHSEMSAFYKVTLGIPISLNSESEEGLTAIPGIGAGLAKAIVLERSKRGGFKDLDDISDIPGIGRRLYKKIRPRLTLEDPI